MLDAHSSAHAGALLSVLELKAAAGGPAGLHSQFSYQWRHLPATWPLPRPCWRARSPHGAPGTPSGSRQAVGEVGEPQEGPLGSWEDGHWAAGTPPAAPPSAGATANSSGSSSSSRKQQHALRLSSKQPAAHRHPAANKAAAAAATAMAPSWQPTAGPVLGLRPGRRTAQPATCGCRAGWGTGR